MATYIVEINHEDYIYVTFPSHVEYDAWVLEEEMINGNHIRFVDMMGEADEEYVKRGMTPRFF